MFWVYFPWFQCWLHQVPWASWCGILHHQYNSRRLSFYSLQMVILFYDVGRLNMLNNYLCIKYIMCSATNMVVGKEELDQLFSLLHVHILPLVCNFPQVVIWKNTSSLKYYISVKLIKFVIISLPTISHRKLSALFFCKGEFKLWKGFSLISKDSSSSLIW